MAATRFLFAVFLLGLLSKGNSQCSVENLKIRQIQTRKNVQGKPEWNVTISNNCPCSQLDIKLACNGFRTVKPIDPTVLSRSRVECLINNGEPVFATSTFHFTYAWDHSFPFKPLSAQVGCS